MSGPGAYQGLLRDASRAGVYHLPVAGRAELLAAAEACGYAVFSIELAEVRGKAGLFAALARDMAMPEWFGKNWDALADCLGDLDWRPAEGYLVLLEHCDLLHEHAAADLAAALQIFQAAAEEWRAQDIAFWCLVGIEADGLAWLPGL